MYEHTFVEAFKSPGQTVATHKVGCQPSDCIYGRCNLSKRFVWVEHVTQFLLFSTIFTVLAKSSCYRDLERVKLFRILIRNPVHVFICTSFKIIEVRLLLGLCCLRRPGLIRCHV